MQATESAKAKPGASLETEEAQARLDLAIGSWVTDHMGFSDVCGGFSAVRIRNENALVMRGYAQHPALVQPYDFFKRQLDDPTPIEKTEGCDVGGLMMSQAIFRSMPHIGALFHCHSPASMVFSALDQEIMPISQFGVMYYRKVPKLPFGDVANAEWCEKLCEALEDAPGVLFGNHGMLTIGRDVPQALFNLYAIEQAMTIQLEALKTGAKINVLSEAEALAEQPGYWGADPTTDYDGTREWAAWSELVCMGRTVTH